MSLDFIKAETDGLSFLKRPVKKEIERKKVTVCFSGEFAGILISRVYGEQLLGMENVFANQDSL